MIKKLFVFKAKDPNWFGSYSKFLFACDKKQDLRFKKNITNIFKKTIKTVPISMNKRGLGSNSHLEVV